MIGGIIVALLALLVERIAEAVAFRLGDEARDELVIDLLVHIDPLDAAAPSSSLPPRSQSILISHPL